MQETYQFGHSQHPLNRLGLALQYHLAAVVTGKNKMYMLQAAQQSARPPDLLSSGLISLAGKSTSSPI
jgi:hypothetical protein